MTQKQRLLDKTESILISNIFPKDKKYPWYPYRMVSPDIDFFYGVWNWDAAFHAIGFLSIDSEIAKEQILGFTAFQRGTDGIFPDLMFYSDGRRNELTEMYADGFIEYHYTKPPVMADAAWQVYEQTHDLDFLETVYPRLVRNESFWTEKRMREGLFHYDADWSEGEEMHNTWVGYESGMDNSPRWDSLPDAYYAIDLNCFIVTMYRALKNMADVLGEDSTVWGKKETALTEQIEKRLWNEEQGIYNDYNFQTGIFGTVLTPCCFMPLFVGIASREHAERCAQAAEKHFLPGMPTVAYDDPSYSLDYWRGPCWLNFAYFAAKGLKNYGFDAQADTVRDTILNWVDRDGDCVHENYDPKTGKGLCQRHFSWSCVFIREFLLNF